MGMPVGLFSMKKIFSIPLFFFLFLGVSFAESSIKAEVNKAKISTDDTLVYKLTITSSEKKISRPKLPEFKDFFVVSKAESSTISLAEGGAKTMLVYAVVLVPKNTGKLSIGPSEFKEEGKTYTSEKFEIEVTPGKLKPKSMPEQKPSQPKKALPESKEPQVTL